MGRSSKDKRDIFYRLAKEEGWRARSAFKLLQINEQFNVLGNVKRAVDLCAAPGSWSQVLAQSLKEVEGRKIVAVDLQVMAPIPGVQILQGDITAESTATEIIRLLGNDKADIVVCDGAPDVTGLHHLDEYLQGQLLLSALNIATCVLAPNGTFIAKMFRSSKSGVDTLFSKVSIFFKEVVIAKPRSSRASSIESFIVGREFALPTGYTPSLSQRGGGGMSAEITMTPAERLIIPFITCGDLQGFDADTTYPLPEGYESKAPVQSPISPPYEEAIRLKKQKKEEEPEKQMQIQLNFGGGAELLVGGSKTRSISLPEGSSLSFLLSWMLQNVVQERPELLIQNNDVRPGILVLINDTDWELCDKGDYCMQPGDEITFISTLHGG